MSATFSSTVNRIKGRTEFVAFYEDICARCNVVPLSVVIAQVPFKHLELNGDKLGRDDWPPLLEALSVNETLESIVIRSEFSLSSDSDNIRGGLSSRSHSHAPAIRSRDVIVLLVKALRSCLIKSQALRKLSLTNIRLRPVDVKILSKALQHNYGLQILSLARCGSVGDDGVKVLCRGLKNLICMEHLDLTECGISDTGVAHLAQLIKHQCVKRANNAWHGTLRYGRPDLDAYGGLKRISLSNNILIDDEGAATLADALNDDIWVRALDLQCCGIGDRGCRALLEMLSDFNKTLCVLDVRQNKRTDPDLIVNIIEQVRSNAPLGGDPKNDMGSVGVPREEYKWKRVDSGVHLTPMRSSIPFSSQPPSQASAFRGDPHRCTLTHARPHQHLCSTRSKSLKTSRCPHASHRTAARSSSQITDSRTRTRSAPVAARKPALSPSTCANPHVPWRAERRAKRFRTHSDTAAACNSDSSLEAEPPQRISVHGLPNGIPPVIDHAAAIESLVAKEDEVNASVAHGEDRAEMKRLKVGLTLAQDECDAERRARKDLALKVSQLTDENRRLEREVQRLRAAERHAHTHHRLAEETTLDGEMLQRIEATFAKFSAFINVLESLGCVMDRLGDVIRNCGLDGDRLSVASLSTISSAGEDADEYVDGRMASRLQNEEQLLTDKENIDILGIGAGEPHSSTFQLLRNRNGTEGSALPSELTAQAILRNSQKHDSIAEMRNALLKHAALGRADGTTRRHRHRGHLHSVVAKARSETPLVSTDVTKSLVDDQFSAEDTSRLAAYGHSFEKDATREETGGDSTMITPVKQGDEGAESSASSITACSRSASVSNTITQKSKPLTGQAALRSQDPTPLSIISKEADSVDTVTLLHSASRGSNDLDDYSTPFSQHGKRSDEPGKPERYEAESPQLERYEAKSPDLPRYESPPAVDEEKYEAQAPDLPRYDPKLPGPTVGDTKSDTASMTSVPLKSVSTGPASIPTVDDSYEDDFEELS